jgi:hypothetical protein
MNGRSPVLARSGEVIEQERRLPPLCPSRHFAAMRNLVAIRA